MTGEDTSEVSAACVAGVKVEQQDEEGEEEAEGRGGEERKMVIRQVANKGKEKR